MSERNTSASKQTRRLAKAAKKIVNEEKYVGPRTYLAKNINNEVEIRTVPNRTENRQQAKEQRQQEARLVTWLTLPQGRVTYRMKVVPDDE